MGSSSDPHSPKIISDDRTMVVLFVDIKGSTPALRALKGKEFLEFVQVPFFTSCREAVNTINEPIEDKKLPNAVINCYMGDGVLIYLDCGDSNDSNVQEIEYNAARKTVDFIYYVVEKFPALLANVSTRFGGISLGLRFGAAMGDRIVLCETTKSKEFQITGEVVNLAARLEHATPAEFLSHIKQARSRAEEFYKAVSNERLLTGTVLGSYVLDADQQVLDLFELCESRYEIRVNSCFKDRLEDANRKDSIRLPWRRLPFMPRGFSGSDTAYVLGGSSAATLIQYQLGT